MLTMTWYEQKHSVAQSIIFSLRLTIVTGKEKEKYEEQIYTYISKYIPLLTARTKVLVMKFSSSEKSAPFMELQGSHVFYAVFRYCSSPSSDLAVTQRHTVKGA